MNVNITTYCNLKCPYCFAVDLWDSAGTKKDDREISLKNLKIVLDFMKRSKIQIFPMFGGEPTLHPQFREVFDLITQSGLSVVVFSNGIMAKDRVEFLKRQKNLAGICINIQHPDDYRVHQKEAIEFTLRELNQHIRLGFVIYKKAFEAYFMIDLINQYDLNRDVKWSIAAPTLRKRNVYIETRDHQEVIERFVEHSRAFKKHQIGWHPDTTYMWCLFSKEQLDELYRNVKFVPLNLCRPVLEVAPNLSVFRCYGTASLTNPRIKITDFEGEKEAYKYFEKKELGLKRMGIFQECFDCSLRGGTCGAGCIAHMLKGFSKGKLDYIY
jgi:MoaA/NifB/PqqE/SkfB family radical SAM enzyme